MFNWFRWIPHPKYGKCGGRSRDCSEKPPRDWMDLAFENHDENLYIASFCEDEENRRFLEKQADKKLGIDLRKGNPKELKLWGRIYRRMAMIIFR